MGDDRKRATRREDQRPAGYEPGMAIAYDPITRMVLVSFRGETVLLAGTFDDEKIGRAAGEEYCRRRGWLAGTEFDPGS